VHRLECWQLGRSLRLLAGDSGVDLRMVGSMLKHHCEQRMTPVFEQRCDLEGRACSGEQILSKHAGIARRCMWSSCWSRRTFLGFKTPRRSSGGTAMNTSGDVPAAPFENKLQSVNASLSKMAGLPRAQLSQLRFPVTSSPLCTLTFVVVNKTYSNQGVPGVSTDTKAAQSGASMMHETCLRPGRVPISKFPGCGAEMGRA
jgi:hypothetical protein